MKTSALYDPRQHATPAQLKAAEARRARQSSIGRKAHEDTSIACPSASARVAALPDLPKRQVEGIGNTSYREVFERAARAHPIVSRFETWFRVIAEGPADHSDASIEQIQRAVVFHFPIVSRRDLRSARRTKEVVMPRQIAMYISKVLTQKSLPEIGRMFGGRDHTTVLFAVRKIERLIKSDQMVAHDVGEIINNLGCRDV